MSISPQNFSYLATAIKDKSGILLSDDKMYLLQSRLDPVARKRQCPDINGLVDKLRASVDRVLLDEIVDAMTTNESLFFRDQKPFEALRDEIMPEVLRGKPGGGACRIWSAACSTGQEPYSVAITLLEAGLRGRFAITATDIATDVLERAKKGLFSQFEVQRGMPIQLLLKYFHQNGVSWQISDDVRRCISFSRLNLMERPPATEKHDVILCRNVLIYFDAATKEKVLQHLTSVLAKDGYLILGGPENLLGLQAATRFKRVTACPSVYRHTG